MTLSKLFGMIFLKELGLLQNFNSSMGIRYEIKIAAATEIPISYTCYLNLIYFVGVIQKQ